MSAACDAYEPQFAIIHHQILYFPYPSSSIIRFTLFQTIDQYTGDCNFIQRRIPEDVIKSAAR